MLGSPGTGDGEAAVPPPPVIDDANDALADAFAPGQQGPRHPNSVHLTTAAAALVNDDAVAASARRAAVASDISTPYDAPPFHHVDPATVAALISEERLLREVLHPRLPPLPLPRRLRLCRALQMPATVRRQRLRPR